MYTLNAWTENGSYTMLSYYYSQKLKLLGNIEVEVHLKFLQIHLWEKLVVSMVLFLGIEKILFTMQFG